jgi:hypothetical protein
VQFKGSQFRSVRELRLDTWPDAVSRLLANRTEGPEGEHLMAIVKRSSQKGPKSNITFSVEDRMTLSLEEEVVLNSHGDQEMVLHQKLPPGFSYIPSTLGQISQNSLGCPVRQLPSFEIMDSGFVWAQTFGGMR